MLFLPIFKISVFVNILASLVVSFPVYEGDIVSNVKQKIKKRLFVRKHNFTKRLGHF